MEDNRLAQRDMHCSFFERCQFAIDNGFCLEALLMEYAAIEARLEVILGMLGRPCSKYLLDADRKKVQISTESNASKNNRTTRFLFEHTFLGIIRIKCSSIRFLPKSSFDFEAEAYQRT